MRISITLSFKNKECLGDLCLVKKHSNLSLCLNKTIIESGLTVTKSEYQEYVTEAALDFIRQSKRHLPIR